MLLYRKCFWFLGKEIQLKHRAPVIGVNIIDGANNAVEPDSKPGETIPPHRVIICSEEQIKVNMYETQFFISPQPWYQFEFWI